METQELPTKAATPKAMERKWLVIFTRPRWEKKVDHTLNQQGIECYCPLKKEYHQWADRVKLVEIPLFVSYIFVRVNAKEQALALYALGVVNYVYYMGKPAVVRDHVIEQLRLNLNIYKDIEVIGLDGLSVGDRVKIKEGLFTNQCGTVVKLQGKDVLMLLDEINCAIVTRVEKQNLILQNILTINEN